MTTAFVETAYNDVFGRAPTDAQEAHFDAQVAYFVKIYTEVGISTEDATLFAKGAVVGQMLGHAAIDGGAVFDYAGAAKAFIAQMGDADFVPGQPLSNFDGQEGGGGGGGGGSPPDTVDYTLVNGVLTLLANGTYAGTLDGVNLRLVEPDGQVRSILLADITKIVVTQATTKLDVAGAVLDNKAIAIDGAGVVNVTGVTFTPASGATTFEPNVNLDQLINTSSAFVAAQSQFLINGTVKDAIKVQWDFWDDKYVGNFPFTYTSAEINEATIRLGAKYINDIDPAHGGNLANAILDITGKAGVDGRSQLLHDNLLGNVGYASMSDRGFSPAKLAELSALIPDDYEARPWIGGYTNDPISAVGVAKAFDYNKGFARPDFVSNKSGVSVDVAGQFSPNTLWFNYNAATNTVTGNTANGFEVSRHDGLGIEIALKVKERGGPDVAGTLGSDGLIHYQVDTGASPAAANRADWSFDFSALTGLNGRSETLNNYTFKLLIDTDKSAATSFQELKLTQIAPGVTPWIDPAGNLTGFIGDDDGSTAGSASRSQNSVNFGFDFLKNIIDSDPATAGIQPYDYSQGQFDIKLIVEDKATGVQLVGQHIVVDVGTPVVSVT